MISAKRRHILSKGFFHATKRSLTTFPAETQSPALHILGSGSIGLFLAAAIRGHHPSFPLEVLLRDHHAKNLKEESQNPYIDVSLQQPSTKNTVLNVRVPASIISQLETTASIQTLVLTTKGFQAVEALQSIYSQLSPTARFIVLCNGGLGVRDELQHAFGGNKWNVELASITHGIYRPCRSNPYFLVHAGVGKIFLVRQDQSNEDQDAMPPAMLNQANLNCQVMSPAEMENILWYKLAGNCVCNPITALHQCTNGEMYNQVPNLDQVIHDIVQEVCAVQRAVRKEKDERLLDEDQMSQFVHELIQDNWNNRTSMQQDVLHQRKTEIGFLNGYIAQTGANHGIDCPMNRQLQRQVLDLENNYSRSEAQDFRGSSN